MEFIQELNLEDKFESIGVASARYCNVLKLDDKHLLVPCNTELRVYSFDTRPPLPNQEDAKLPEEANPSSDKDQK